LRFLLSRRWLLFALLVVVLCYATWWLGEWQFHRLADRKESNQVIRTNEHRSPAPVADVLATHAAVSDADEWRLVTATGTYDTDDTVVVRYRTRDGQSGVDAVVPLVTVRANATGDSTDVDDHSTRAISSEQIGPAIGQPVYGGFVQLKAEDGRPADGLEPVELPELDNGPHFFYGLQWWFFGLLAIVGFGYLAYDEWRGRGRGGRTADDTTDDTADDTTEPEVLAERKRRRNAKNARKQAVRAAYQRAYERERQERQEAQSARAVPGSTGTTAPETGDDADADESSNAATRPRSSGSP
jgi:cytochrome oxidase assembly protein ShyY1